MTRQRMVVYRGASQLDGTTPIVALATYDTSSQRSSKNSKTGDMVQVWILRDDAEPHTALKSGLDGPICGDCPHRSPASGGTGACYVLVHNAPLSTYRAYKRGNFTSYDPAVFTGRKVRFGAYGDPAAVPLHIWDDIASHASNVTGYTHQWQHCDPGYARHCMASVDDVADWPAAKAAGYRSFVVRAAGSAKPKGLIVCPASAEAGKRTTCSACLSCGGTGNGRRGDVTIEAHGAARKRFGVGASLPLAVI